ncbi:putative transposable element protein, partial [Trifolium medium]|nr:putative transposable element protein [Trifolium medium]
IKEMLICCPHRGLEVWLVVHIFYNGLSYKTRMTVDATMGGALMNKNVDEAHELTEEMAQNHFQ